MTTILNVGDVIYTTWLSTVHEYKIDRVPEKRAFSGHKQFYREANSGGSFGIIGADKWQAKTARFADEKIEKINALHKLTDAIEAAVKASRSRHNAMRHATVEQITAEAARLNAIAAQITPSPTDPNP